MNPAILRGPARRGAFTLVELMVVIAVIAILMALVFPSLRGAMERGKTLQCLSNLRQIGVAQEAYITENRQRLPQAQNIDQPVVNKTPGCADELMTWQLQLAPYLGGPSDNHSRLPSVISGCPKFLPIFKTYLDREPIDPSTGRNLTVRGYAINPHLVLEGKTDPNYSTKVSKLNLIMDWYVHPYEGYHSVTEVTKPSSRAAFADSNDVWFYAAQGPFLYYTTGKDAGRFKWWDPRRHGDFANYVMFDGSAFSLRPNEGWAALAAPGDPDAYNRDW